jgi:hypothetical protein
MRATRHAHPIPFNRSDNIRRRPHIMKLLVTVCNSLRTLITTSQPISLRSFLTLPSHPLLGLPSDSFLQFFRLTFCMHFWSILTLATWDAHLTLLHSIVRIITGEMCKLWSSSLCSLLQPPATSSLLVPNIPPAPCSQIPLTYFLLLVSKTKFHTHTKQRVKVI